MNACRTLSARRATPRQVRAPTLSPMTFIVELLHADAQPPRRATEGSAGYDLCAYLQSRSIKCSDGQRTWDAAPETGDGADELRRSRAASPRSFRSASRRECRVGIEAQIRPRSGTSFKKGLQIPNAPGTIDSDYPDEWMVIVKQSDAGADSHRARRADRADGARRATRSSTIESGSVTVSTSRVGGFGSTGR